MSQQIRVLQCCECKIYQVDIVKKAPKWQCTVCHTKQIVQKEFMRGTGAACRAKTQELNMKAAEIKHVQEDFVLTAISKLPEDTNEIEQSHDDLDEYKTTEMQKSSKWTAYVDEESVLTNSTRYNENIPKNFAKKRKSQAQQCDDQKSPIKNIDTNNRNHSKKMRSKWDNFL